MDNTTQSRSLPTIPIEYYYTQNGTSYRGNPNASSPPIYMIGGNQVTTSYRTKRGEILNPTGPGFDQTSGSQGAFQRELQAEAKEGGVRSLFNYGRTDFDNGHEFETEKTTYDWGRTSHQMYAPGTMYGDLGYVGYVLPVTSPGLPVYSVPPTSEILLDGTKLFKAARPTKPEAGLMQLIFETRQDVPKAIGVTAAQRGFNRQSAGGEYLNLEFGLLPTWSDLQKLSKSVLHAGSLLKQYKRNARQQVRRRRSLPTVSSVTEVVGPFANPAIGSFFGQVIPDFFWVPDIQLGVTSVTDVVQTDVWFSGAFTYYVNEGHSILDRLDRYEQEANYLLGTRFSADTFWELSPFSWLADWYSDTGTFISNVVALDSDELVMKYGYVMCETRATRTYLKTGLTPRPGATAPATLRTDVSYVHKVRHRASPYGFGLSDTDLTIRQKAILGALGLSGGSGSRVL